MILIYLQALNDSQIIIQPFSALLFFPSCLSRRVCFWLPYDFGGVMMVARDDVFSYTKWGAILNPRILKIAG